MSDSTPTSPLRILLVEDSEHDRLAFRRALKKGDLPFDIVECVRAEEAMERLEGDAPPFDLVVVDHALPGMSGLDLSKELLQRNLQAPLVILTGRGSEQLAVEALKLGVNDYIIKDPHGAYLELLPVLLPQVQRQYADRLARKEAEEALRKAHQELERRIAERTAKLAETTMQLEIELVERRHAEESLRLREERFRSVAQTANDAIITINSEGRVVFWNHAARRIFGYAAEEADGRPLGFIIPKRFKRRHEMGLQRVVLEGEPSIIGSTVEMMGLRKDGTDFPIELSLASWKTEEGSFFTGIVRDISRRKRAEEEVRHLSQQLMVAIEEERKRLARDLHDEAGQVLTALHLGVESLQNALPEALTEQKASCGELLQLIERLSDTARRISCELRPDMLDHLGLVPTLEWHIRDFVKRRPAIDVDFKTIGAPKRPDGAIEIVLYRLVQEALNNIAKHASARHVEVLLAFSHPEVILTIKDDGVGFDRKARRVARDEKRQGIGLVSMRERVASVGGTIEIRSARGKGTVVRAELPFHLNQGGAT